MLDKVGVDYDWTIYTNKINYDFKSKNITTKEQQLDLTKEIKKSTYLVQLSSCESFGLSVCESLILGTPVIVTDLPAFKEIGCKHGENAIICDLDMKSVDIDMIKKGLPTFKYKAPKSNWDKYLTTESDYDPKDLVRVRTKKRIWDLETDIHYLSNQKIVLSKQRASYFEALDYVEVLDAIKKESD